MKKLLYCVLAIILYTNQTQSASQLPLSLTGAATKTGINASRKFIGHERTNQFINYAKTGKDWWNWYFNSLARPTNPELLQHSLWYGIKSGTIRSMHGEDPARPFYEKVKSWTPPLERLKPIEPLRMQNSNRQRELAQTMRQHLIDQHLLAQEGKAEKNLRQDGEFAYR